MQNAWESTLLPLLSSTSCVSSQLCNLPSATVFSPCFLYQRVHGELPKHQNRKTQKNKEEKERREGEGERGRRGLSQLLLGGVSSDSSFWLYSQFFR